MINVSKLYCGLAGQSDDLRYNRRDSLGPVVVFNCTPQCNLRCLHCYSASDSTCPRDNEIITAEAKKLLSEFAEMRCPVVLFSGGEPLLRKDLFELLAEANQLGLRTVLSTNGTLIDGRTAEKLAEAGTSYVGISIDGNEQFHDIFRQSKGSFRAAIDAFESCRKAGLRTGLRFTIIKANASQIPAVFDIAAENGIRRLCFYHLIRTGRAKDLDDQILSKQQTRDVLDAIIEKTDDFVKKGFVDEVLTVGNHADGPYILVKMKQKRPAFETAQLLLRNAGGNRIGQGIVCVDWRGDVHPDQFWRNYSLGNVSEKSFKQIWTNQTEPVLNMLRNKGRFADKRCLKCRWFDLCRGNYRFLGDDPAEENWLNEPGCYLTDKEIEL